MKSWAECSSFGGTYRDEEFCDYRGWLTRDASATWILSRSSSRGLTPVTLLLVICRGWNRWNSMRWATLGPPDCTWEVAILFGVRPCPVRRCLSQEEGERLV
jgi:hypothetical protein